MDEILLKIAYVVANGVFGFFLQLLAYVLLIFIMSKRTMSVKKVLVMAIPFSLLAYFFREIVHLTGGSHMIIIVMTCGLLSVLVFKMPVYPTILAMLIMTMSTILLEGVTVLFADGLLGAERARQILLNATTIEEKLTRSLLGIPTNLLLLLEAYITHVIIRKKKGM